MSQILSSQLESHWLWFVTGHCQEMYLLRGNGLSPPAQVICTGKGTWSLPWDILSQAACRSWFSVSLVPMQQCQLGFLNSQGS